MKPFDFFKELSDEEVEKRMAEAKEQSWSEIVTALKTGVRELKEQGASSGATMSEKFTVEANTHALAWVRVAVKFINNSLCFTLICEEVREASVAPLNVPCFNPTICIMVVTPVSVF